jgi:hypothetical protein
MFQLVDLVQSPLILVVNEVAPGSVWTESGGVEGTAQLGLVLRMSCKGTQLVGSMSELALVSILAVPALFEGSAQLGLVATGVNVCVALLLLLLLLQVAVAVRDSNGLAHTAVQLAVECVGQEMIRECILELQQLLGLSLSEDRGSL